MPNLRGDDNSLVIIPEGDIIFATCDCPSGNGDKELVIIQHPENVGSGSLKPDFIGVPTDQLDTLVRIKLNLRTCAILMERLALTQIALHGMPSLVDEAREGK